MHLQFRFRHATLVLPSPALRRCVRAYLMLDIAQTPATGSTADAHRLNHYPASVFCGLGWFLQGQSEVVSPGEVPQPVPSAVFVGPQTRPWVTRHRGAVRSFGVLFYPQAFYRLTGVPLDAHLDSLRPLDPLLGPEWLDLGTQVLQAPDTASRLARVEAFLRPRWKDVQGGGGALDGVSAWWRALQAQAEAQGWGQSARSLVRFATVATGQPLRRLAWLSRAEATLTQARRLSGDSPPLWSEVAAQGGYADQAHLCRDTRRVTGCSPAELARRVDSDEGYWLYRLWS